MPDDPPGTAWAVFALDRAAAKAWRDLCASHRNACQRAYDQLCVDPYYVDGDRWIVLAGKHRHTRQHEIGGGARLWFRIYDDQGVVLIAPHPAHPKSTERKRG